MDTKDNVKQLAALFDRDHMLLLKMLDDASYLCCHGSHVSAAKVYREFRQLQERHLESEEVALEELVREGTCPSGIAARISHDHALLKQLIEETWKLFNCSDRAALAAAMNSLVRAINGHERSEKEELLPILCSSIKDPVHLERVVHRLAD